MFTQLVITALLAILFGLAWHDQPAASARFLEMARLRSKRRLPKREDQRPPFRLNVPNNSHCSAALEHNAMADPLQFRLAGSISMRLNYD